MHPNHEYALAHCPADGRILDFGCGSGSCVLEARARGFDAIGVDAYMEPHLRAEAMLGDTVLAIDGYDLPFPDGHFDFAFSNMVFEHVEDLPRALRELARVLKPGAELLAAFAGRESVVEGHVHVPFVHWLPARARERYLRAVRRLGLGAGGEGKDVQQWARVQARWLERFTFYRSHREVAGACNSAGFTIRHIEHDYLAFRLRRLGCGTLARAALLLAPVSRRVSRWHGAQVIQAVKSPLSS